MTREQIKQAAREIYASATVDEWAAEVANLVERERKPLLDALMTVKDNAVFRGEDNRAALDAWVIDKCRSAIEP